jgi:hypothetical protein
MRGFGSCGGGEEELFFEAFDLDVASPAISLVLGLLVVVDRGRAEVVGLGAVAAGVLFTLEAAGSAGPDDCANTTSTTSSGYGGEGGGEGEGGASGRLGEHRRVRVGGDRGEERLGNCVELCACVERGHCEFGCGGGGGW